LEQALMLVGLIERSFHDQAVDQLDSLLDPNMIVHGPFPMEQGAEAFKRTLAATRRAFPDMRIQIEAGAVREGLVFRRWRMTGTHEAEFLGIAPTGRSVQLSGVDIERIENGRIVEHWTYWDRLSLAEQLGVSGVPFRPEPTEGSGSPGTPRRHAEAPIDSP
jgi:steroid delta-isomerase-like uncharacterized protein